MPRHFLKLQEQEGGGAEGSEEDEGWERKPAALTSLPSAFLKVVFLHQSFVPKQSPGAEALGVVIDWLRCLT